MHRCDGRGTAGHIGLSRWFCVAAIAIEFADRRLFLVHVWGKFNAGHARIAAAFGNNYGLPMPGLFAYAAMGMELIGGICLIIGLFTRFWAAALAVEIGIALIVAHLPKGYSIGAGGYEYVLLIGVVLLTIAMRGGGPYWSTPRSARNSKNQHALKRAGLMPRALCVSRPCCRAPRLRRKARLNPRRPAY